MSSVANVMISVSIRDAAGFAELNDWMASQHEHLGDAERFGSLTESGWGGTKAPEVRLYGAALNHWNLQALVDRVTEIPWRDRNVVQLFICDQDDSTFGVWMFTDGALREVLRPRVIYGEPLPFNAIWDDNHPLGA